MDTSQVLIALVALAAILTHKCCCFSQYLLTDTPDDYCDQLLRNRTLSQTFPTYQGCHDLNILYEYKYFLCFIANRLKLGRQVALYKWTRGIPIFDPTREQTILANVVIKANASGLDIKWSKAFFQNQMEANRQIQEYFIDKWACNNVKFVASSAVDLHATIRPQIDQINSALIALALRTRDLRNSQWCPCLTDFEVNHIAHTFADRTEADIFHHTALRNICLI